MISTEDFKKEGWGTWTGVGDPDKTWPSLWVSKRVGNTGMYDATYRQDQGTLELQFRPRNKPSRGGYFTGVNDIKKFKEIFNEFKEPDDAKD